METYFYHGVVLGEPKAQPRHRHFQRGSFVQTYDPAKKLKGTFASILQQEAPEKPVAGSLYMELSFYMSRPKNHYGSGKNASVLKPSAPEWHISKPDLDNLEKFVKDALKGIFYKDDSQICQTLCQKLYSDKPRIDIILKSIL